MPWPASRRSAESPSHTLAERFGGRVELERLPAYLPELNPVEHVWGHTKHGDLVNYIAEDAGRLRSAINDSLLLKRNRPNLLRSFFKAAGLEL